MRHILDAEGLANTAIVASGNLDEYQLAKLIASSSVDTALVSAPGSMFRPMSLRDCAYRLQEYAGRPRLKQSEQKPPGRVASKFFAATITRGRFQETIR